MSTDFENNPMPAYYVVTFSLKVPVSEKSKIATTISRQLIMRTRVGADRTKIALLRYNPNITVDIAELFEMTPEEIIAGIEHAKRAINWPGSIAA